MASVPQATFGSVERFPSPPPPTAVAEELGRILALLREACPPGAEIRFEFDGILRVHIDVRTMEDVTRVESVLPMFGRDLFSDLSRAATPQHPFHHRVSAVVTC